MICARLEGGGDSLRPGDVAVENLFGRVAARHEPDAKRKGILLTTSVGAGAEILYGDPLRLEQAVQNLAANALRHTPSGGEVELRAEVYGDHVFLSVRDTGVGVPRNICHSCSTAFTKLIRRELETRPLGADWGCPSSRRSSAPRWKRLGVERSGRRDGFHHLLARGNGRRHGPGDGRTGNGQPVGRRHPMTFAVFASGAAALIFQIVWLHEAGLVFGNGVWATSLVLASFMGGLAVGNAVVAFAVVRVHRRLLVYAQLEAIVGLSGLALTYVFPYLVVLIAPLTGAIAQHLWLVNLIRLVLAFAILLVPATAMGATLPIVVGACAERDAGLGPVLGRLYGWNTLGAVVGVICAEVVTVGRVGIRGSGVVAALLDITAAVTALYVSGRSSRRGAFDVDRPQSSVMPSWRWLACAFLSGGALLSLEVIWFRFLTMYVLSTTMAVSVMLATVLASIALGGLFASRWLTRRPDVAGTLAATTLAAGATAAGTYLAFHRLTSGTQIAEWYRVLWLACVLAAPTSFLSGVIYTLTGHVIQRDLLRRAGSDDTGDTSTGATAWLTLANTAGAMCGPLLAAFVLLPAIGIEGAILVLAAAYAGIAILVLGSTTEWRGVAASPAFLAVAVALTIAIASFVVASPRDRDFARAAQTYGADGSQIVATREGPSETIFLMQQRWLGQPVYDRLVTNGFSMSGDSVPAMRYMRYFAYLADAAPPGAPEARARHLLRRRRNGRGGGGYLEPRVDRRRRNLERRRRHERPDVRGTDASAARPPRPSAPRGRASVSADEPRPIRSRHRRTAATADTRRGEYLHTRILPADLRPSL